jgi:hypothetical protein
MVRRLTKERCNQETGEPETEAAPGSPAQTLIDYFVGGEAGSAGAENSNFDFAILLAFGFGFA